MKYFCLFFLFLFLFLLAACGNTKVEERTDVGITSNITPAAPRPPEPELPKPAELPKPSELPKPEEPATRAIVDDSGLPHKTPEDEESIQPMPVIKEPMRTNIFVENFVWRSEDRDFAMEARRIGSSYLYDTFTKRGLFKICTSPAEAEWIMKGFVNFATNYKVMIRTGGTRSSIGFGEVTLEVQMHPKDNASAMSIKTCRAIAAGHGDEKSLLFKAFQRAIFTIATDFAVERSAQGIIMETRGNRSVAKVNIGSNFMVQPGEFIEIMKNGMSMSTGKYMVNRVFPGYAWVEIEPSTKSEVKKGLTVVYRVKPLPQKSDRDIVREDLAITGELDVEPLKDSEKEMIQTQNLDANFNAKVWVNKKEPSPVYYSNDKLVVYFQSAENCYVRLIALQTDGTEYEFFPNRFHPDNFVEANRVYSVPAAGDPFEITIEPPEGIERIKLIASKEKLGETGNYQQEQVFKEVQTRNISMKVRTKSLTGIVPPWATAYCEFEIKK